MKRSRTLRSLVLLSAVAIPLSACGSDSDDSSDSGGGGAATTDLSVAASEFEYSPDSATVVAGEAVTVTLDNGGAVEHNYSVVASGETIESEDDISDDLIVASVDAVAAGATGSGTITVDAGEYQVICTIEGHLDAGMEGSLTAE